MVTLIVYKIRLLGIFLGKSVVRGLYNEPINKPNHKLGVDDMPIIEVLEKLNYLELLTNYRAKHEKELKAVVHRKSSKTKAPKNLTFPHRLKTLERTKERQDF